jgi:coenzyme PQQ precursor peptide PqqA
MMSFNWLSIYIDLVTNLKQRGLTMWTKPKFEEMRLGFEVTLYISNR